MNYFKNGDIIKCLVTGIEKYGIFVKIGNYNGLIHISEISSYYVKNISDFVSIDEEIYARILDIDQDKNQLKLSIKDINYKINNKKKIQETVRGFYPLKEKINDWIKDKIVEYKKN